VVLLPIDPQFKAFVYVFQDRQFWLCYANTLFLTLMGTIFSMLVSIFGAYALSKKRLPFGRVLNFLLVFTMWFSAGLFATKLNYEASREIFHQIGIHDEKWLVVIAMGVNAYNIILLRNGFAGVPTEIEEAALVDGATEFQIANKIYIPMTKATIATVALFYGISRWNGYFWAAQVMTDPNQHPLQVYIRKFLNDMMAQDSRPIYDGFAQNSLFYCMIVAAIIPIIIIYPFIQKYFAAGVNLGGVKE
jgi:putative aldouronate transport system permease protein